MSISEYKKLYSKWQVAATMDKLYWRELERAAFELMLHLPYWRFKKLMHIDGGPWF